MSRSAEERDLTRSCGRPEGLPKLWSATGSCDAGNGTSPSRKLRDGSGCVLLPGPERHSLYSTFARTGVPGSEPRRTRCMPEAMRPDVRSPERSTRNMAVSRACYMSPGSLAKTSMPCLIAAWVSSIRSKPARWRTIRNCRRCWSGINSGWSSRSLRGMNPGLPSGSSSSGLHFDSGFFQFRPRTGYACPPLPGSALPSPARDSQSDSGSVRHKNRVGGGLTPPVPPHHRTYGSVSGGSS